MKLAGIGTGLQINFHGNKLKEGLKRLLADDYTPNGRLASARSSSRRW
jgi:hypothetical protein